jgi:uncharacterized protein YhfF
MYLPAGPSRPDPQALSAFQDAARAARPDAGLDTGFQVRWIGLDAPTTRQIFDLIRARDKTGTFTLPWIVERTDRTEPRVGDCIVLIDFDGRPTLLVRTVRTHLVRFGDITAQDIAVDGTPVRDLAVWRPLHISYWNAMLQPFGLAVTDDMPVWVEKFELVYDADATG